MDNKLINEIISLAENGGARGNDITAVYSRVYIALKKSLGITPYAEQIGAALALTGHNMVQMQTGEGKTFSAVFAACYEALSGGQVMILTFNDYLARRDYEWTKPVYDSMGVSLGCITADTPRTDRGRYTQSRSCTSPPRKPASTTCGTSYALNRPRWCSRRS